MASDKQILVPTTVGTVTDAGGGVWTTVLTTAETSAQFSNLGDDGLLGEYRWQEFVQKAGATERKYLRWGMSFVKVNLESGGLTTGLDIRPHVKKMLDAIRALLVGKATKDQASYSIAGRALARYSWDDLVRMEGYYASHWDRHLAQERYRRDQESPALVRGRFPAAGTY
jgi:hypothetical protein